MLRTCCCAIFLVVFGLAIATDSPLAMPTGAFSDTNVANDGLFVRANGCHGKIKTHYDRRLGRTVAHYHRKDQDCRSKRAKDEFRSGGSGRCHRDVEMHRIWDGGPRVWHYHKGNNCRPVEVSRSRKGHCHRDARDHNHDGWGWTVHRHDGSNCRVRPYREQYRDRGYGGCIQLGILYFCP